MVLVFTAMAFLVTWMFNANVDAQGGAYATGVLVVITSAAVASTPKPGGVVAEIHQQVAGLLGGPRSVGMPRHAQDVQVAIADLEHEQDVEPPQRERAVDVEEVDREHAGRLRAQELPPTGVGAPRRRRWDPVTLEDATDGRGAHAVAECEQLALDPHVAQRGFSRAIRTTRATRTSSIGGRPVRFG